MKIVVGFIDTPQGRAAVDAAVDEARARNGSLVIVNSKLGGDHDEAKDFLAMAEAIKRIDAHLAGTGIEYEIHEFARGQKPSKDLVQAAADYGAEMIVIGIRARTATGKMLLGSNALEILHDSPVPVLCVKAE